MAGGRPGYPAPAASLTASPPDAILRPMVSSFPINAFASLLAIVAVCLLALGRDSASSQTLGPELKLLGSVGGDDFDSLGLVAWTDDAVSSAVFVAWLENELEDDPTGGVRLCHSDDPMSPPTNCQSLPEEPGNATFLSVAGAGDSRYAAWQQYTSDPYSGEFRIAHSMDAGEMWSSPETIATDAYAPRVVAYDNLVVAGWQDSITGDAMVREGIPVGNGISWGLPVTIATGMWLMDMAMGGDGTLWMFSANAFTVQVNTVPAGQNPPGKAQVIGNSGVSAFDLDFLYDEGVLVPLFVYTDFLSQRLYVVCLGVDGWGEPVLVAVNAGGLAGPVIAASGGNAYAAWQADAGDRFMVRGRSIQCDEDGTAVPGEPLLLSDEERNSFGPQVSINGPRLYIAWNESPVDDVENVDVRLKAGRVDDYPSGGSEYIDPTFDYPFQNDFIAFMLVLAHANVNIRTPGIAS